MRRMEQVLTRTPTLAAAAPPQMQMQVMPELEDLMRAHQAQVMRVAMYALGDAEEAATVTQDCFLRAHESREQFRGEGTAASWLLAIAHNLIRDRIRARRFQFWRRAARSALDAAELAEALPSGEASPEKRALAREQVRQVTSALGRLSERQRSVFVLRFVEDMELAEIAAATGLKLASVKTHLYRALEAVRGELGAGRGAAK